MTVGVPVAVTVGVPVAVTVGVGHGPKETEIMLQEPSSGLLDPPVSIGVEDSSLRRVRLLNSH